MSEKKQNNDQSRRAEMQDLQKHDMQTVEGGRRVDDGCYLYYGYYCPSNELKPFGG